MVERQGEPPKLHRQPAGLVGIVGDLPLLLASVRSSRNSSRRARPWPARRRPAIPPRRTEPPQSRMRRAPGKLPRSFDIKASTARAASSESTLSKIRNEPGCCRSHRKTAATCTSVSRAPPARSRTMAPQSAGEVLPQAGGRIGPDEQERGELVGMAMGDSTAARVLPMPPRPWTAAAAADAATAAIAVPAVVQATERLAGSAPGIPRALEQRTECLQRQVVHLDSLGSTRGRRRPRALGPWARRTPCSVRRTGRCAPGARQAGRPRPKHLNRGLLGPAARWAGPRRRASACRTAGPGGIPTACPTTRAADRSPSRPATQQRRHVLRPRPGPGRIADQVDDGVRSRGGIRPAAPAG